ncbi:MULTISPECIES: helix-turn-helix transcriptional regulator [Brevibacterium]|nr:MULTISPECIES: LuxR C-terminal-related transcriptional regulator [Brevibacterium]MCM1013450.1 LuxR C-terminal-related transcriptional regulator [Brevibacterium sp. XM4083]
MNPHSTSTPSPEPGAFDLFLGPRIIEEKRFACRVATEFPDTDLAAATVTSLFDLTAGRIRIARDVIVGADRAQVDLDALDSDRFSTLLVPLGEDSELTGHLGEVPPAVRLLQVLAHVSVIDQPTVALARQAIPRLEAVDATGLPSIDEMTSQLVFAGLLRIDTDRPGTYAMPGLVRSVARRFDQTPAPSGLTARRALSCELEESFRSLLDIGTFRLEAIFGLIADLEAWSLLAEVWAERGFNVFYPEFLTAVRAILSAPASAARGSLVLAEAQSAAREIANISTRTGSTDPREVLALVTFDRLDVPTLEQERVRLDNGDFTANEVAVMTLRSMRDRRQQGDLDGGVRAAEEGNQYLFARQSQAAPLSRLYDARLLMERGLDLARTGDVRRGQDLVDRAVTISETILPFDPYPLVPGLAIAALGHVAAGFGPKSEGCLRRYDELRSRFDFHTLQTDFIANTPRLHRALDQLDLEASAAAIAISKRLAPDQLGSRVYRYGEVLHNVYSGTAGLYLKEHSLAPENQVTNTDLQIVGSAYSLMTILTVATGALREAQALAAQAPLVDRKHGLSRARVGFALGQYDVVDSSTSHVLITGTDPKKKGSALALRAASMHRRGRETAALADVDNALDYCIVAGSVLPLALLPSDIREAFVRATAASRQWDLIAATFELVPVTGEELRARLLALPQTFFEAQVENRLLDSQELDLLFRLEKATPLARIAADLSLAEGTVKNRLSAIYRKLGVRNRRDAVEYGYRNGYFS